MSEMKPCPFCGGLAIIAEDSGRNGSVFNVWHQCKKGKGHFNKYGSVDTLTIDTGWYDTRNEAIDAWNRRTVECDREALLSVCREIEESDVDGISDWPERIRKAIGEERS